MDYSGLRETFKAEPSWTQKHEEVILEPFNYLCGVPGKEVRTHLIDAFNLWLQVPEPDLDVIRNLVRMLHHASLLVDDVEDDAELRRGLPVAHAIFGVPQTINTANYVYFLAFDQLLKLRPNDGKGGKGGDMVAMVTDELLHLHRGQGLDLYWRDSLTCPTEEEYVQMTLGKTGGLFRIAVKLMMAKSDSNVDYVPLVNLISIFFQIRDDYMNLQSDQYAENKGFCEDLTEGKFSFPVVHGVRADTSNRQILSELAQTLRKLITSDVLQKRTTSVSLKKHIVDYLANTTKSFEYTRGVLDTILKQIEDEIRVLGGNPKLEKIIGLLKLPEGKSAKERSDDSDKKEKEAASGST